MSEDLPYRNRHRPSQSRVTQCIPDPDLCLTPDVRKNASPKSRKVRFSDVRHSLEYDSPNDIEILNYRKNENYDPLSVRANKNNSKPRVICHKEYKPQRYSEDNYIHTDDLNIQYSKCSIKEPNDNHPPTRADKKTYKYLISEINDSIDDSIQSIDSNSTSTNSGNTRTTQIEITTNKIKSADRGVEIVIDCDGQSRRKHSTERNPEYGYPFTESNTDAAMDYSAYSKPEYNSTLRIGEEIKALKAAKPDVVKVVTEKLKSSETLRTAIGEKAATRVNRSHQQFSDLVSVDVSEVKVVKQAERHKQKPQSRPTTQGASKYPEPDLMRFFTEDLQQESVDLSLHGLGVKLPPDRLSSAELSGGYDMYQRNQVWNKYF